MDLEMNIMNISNTVLSMNNIIRPTIIEIGEIKLIGG